MALRLAGKVMPARKRGVAKFARSNLLICEGEHTNYPTIMEEFDVVVVAELRELEFVVIIARESVKRASGEALRHLDGRTFHWA